MRKMVLLVAMLAMVLATATVAYGAVRDGNGYDNYIRETCNDDTLRGYGGDDTLDANNCGGDEDLLRGGTGTDRLLADDGDRRDVVSGGPGYDTCVVDARVELAGGCNDIRIR
jgi:Ca2+-binding RTX toxin-like protein